VEVLRPAGLPVDDLPPQVKPADVEDAEVLSRAADAAADAELRHVRLRVVT
jgi:hypothetical protein